MQAAFIADLQKKYEAQSNEFKVVQEPKRASATAGLPPTEEMPAVSTPKRASATAELPPTEVRSKRACAGRNEREGRGQVSEERGSAWERARPVRVRLCGFRLARDVWHCGRCVQRVRVRGWVRGKVSR